MCNFIQVNNLSGLVWEEREVRDIESEPPRSWLDRQRVWREIARIEHERTRLDATRRRLLAILATLPDTKSQPGSSANRPDVGRRLPESEIVEGYACVMAEGGP